MPASTTLIANLKTVQSNGPSAVTTANSDAQAGPIVDYPGQVNGVLLMLEEAKVALGGIGGTQGLIGMTDPTTDAANLALLQNVLLSLS